MERLAKPTVRVLESVEPGSYRLVHERFIPATRRLAGAVLTGAEKASRLLASRFALWVREGKARRYLLDGKELREVEREFRWIRWGGSEEGKRRYLDVSFEKRRKGRVVVTALSAGILFGFAWLGNWFHVEVQRERLAVLGFPLGFYDMLPKVRELVVTDTTTDLRWLERAISLEKLELSLSGNPDLSRIPGSVTQLSLDLSSSQVSDLSGLPDSVTQLSLDLTGSRVSDLSGLPDSVTQLSLDLGGSQVSDLSGLPDSVTQLSLDLDHSQVSDLADLSNNVTELALWIGDSPIRDLSGLPNGVSRLALDLRNSKVSSLSGLPDNTSQLTLVLSRSSVRLLSGLPESTTQLSLDLRGSRVSSLSDLPDNIVELKLALGLYVKSLSGLPGTVTELELDLGNSKIASLNELPSGVAQLRLSFLGMSQITDVFGYQYFPSSLPWLGCKLDLLDDVSNGPQLQLDFWSIGDCPVSSLSDLPVKITKLNLNLSDSQIDSLEGIPNRVNHLVLFLGPQVSDLSGLPDSIVQLELVMHFAGLKGMDVPVLMKPRTSGRSEFNLANTFKFPVYNFISFIGTLVQKYK